MVLSSLLTVRLAVRHNLTFSACQASDLLVALRQLEA